MRDLRVLLFSPLPDRDPPSGDVSYSLALLSEPPRQVSYVTYEEALQDGTLRVRGRRPRRGSSALDLVLFVLRAVEVALRRSGVAFREPTWFVTIEPGAYDLVHQHVFSVRQIGPKTPVVTSSGYPLPVVYRNVDGWGRFHLGCASAFDWAWAVALQVANPNQAVPRWTVMSGYSARYARWLERRSPAKREVLVISTGLEWADPIDPAPRKEQLLFVGRDFHRKGGDVAMEAFQLLRGAGAHLTVVSRPRDCEAVAGDRTVRLLSEVDRSTVTTELIPAAGVLVAPTRADCGVPYVILEALRGGTPVVTSNHPWLDERLVSPGVRRVEAEAHSVAAAVQEVWSDYESSCTAARELWEAEFSMDVLGTRLRGAYDRALDQFETHGRREVPIP